ncbi:MAG: phosphoglycerate dehydrogenase [Synergistales bacterium]|nr:phosphoglycerate dehydrogenase [Synergistales bacterium]
MWKILITDVIDAMGIELLQQARDVAVEQRLHLSAEELREAIGGYDALITRSGTPLDAGTLHRAKRLKVVARAGVGVDNIDLVAASKLGIVVLNAPTGNTLAATELTFADTLALLRKVPQASRSVMEGKWERKAYVGIQLYGKTLLIVGLGRIGSNVARRAKAFGMQVLAYDPYIAAEKAEHLSVELVDDLHGALALADVVTLHVPLTGETRCMVDEVALKAMKEGAYLVNCARGPLLDEPACAAALRRGHLAGIATDVYASEPPGTDHPLFSEDLLDRVVATPHIGANTREAQSEVSRIAAANLLAALRGSYYEHAVNLPFMHQQLDHTEKQYLALARKIGNVAATVLRMPPETVKVTHRGTLSRKRNGPVPFDAPCPYSPYTTGTLKGLLEIHQGPEVSYMGAPLLAEERGIQIEESWADSTTYLSMIEGCVAGGRDEVRISGTVTEDRRQRIVQINGYWLEFIPEGTLLIFQNHDRPGVIGTIGTVLGDAGINIANFALGRKNGSGLALGAVQVDSAIGGATLDRLQEAADLLWAVEIHFPDEGAVS